MPQKVFLISLDTLRADHLGCYGYARNTSPNIDQFSKECILFKKCFSPGAYTYPSFCSLFSGQYPSQNSFGFRHNNELTFHFSLFKKLEKLEKAGFVSSIVLSNTHLKGIADNFEHFDDAVNESEYNRPEILFRSAEQTLEKAKSWLKTQKNDFFCWIHLMDIHGPYSSSKLWWSDFVDDQLYRGKHELITRIGSNDGFQTEKLSNEEKSIPEYQVLWTDEEKNHFIQDVSEYIARYDGNIRYVDYHLEKFFQFLKHAGLYDDALIILHADHGEAFGENNVYFYHGLHLTEDQIRVPLMIKLPQGIDHKIIDTPVSLVDVYYTILKYLNIRSDEQNKYFRSLINYQNDAHRIIYSQTINHFSLYQNEKQMIYEQGLMSMSNTNGKIFRANIMDGFLDTVDFSKGCMKIYEAGQLTEVKKPPESFKVAFKQF